MGRQKQPVDLILAKGRRNMTRQEISERKASEVKAASDEVVAPSYLPNNLKEKFNKIAHELLRINIMTNLDCEALARYVTTEAQYQKVTKELLRMGVKNLEYEALLRLQEKIFKMARGAASDLGLTITSRCKLVVPKQEESQKESRFAKFGAG